MFVSRCNVWKVIKLNSFVKLKALLFAKKIYLIGFSLFLNTQYFLSSQVILCELLAAFSAPAHTRHTTMFSCCPHRGVKHLDFNFRIEGSTKRKYHKFAEHNIRLHK